MRVGENDHGQTETGRSQVKVNGLLMESERSFDEKWTVF